MTIRATRNISLTYELHTFVEDRVASGEYGSASEVVRAALRLLIEQRRQAAEPADQGAQSAR